MKNQKKTLLFVLVLIIIITLVILIYQNNFFNKKNISDESSINDQNLLDFSNEFLNKPPMPSNNEIIDE